MMKIVQTYWNPDKQTNNLFMNVGGFLSPEIHWMAWALSCLQLRKFYPDVELHTDEKGKRLFEMLGIPYTKIHTSLETDFMRQLNPNMWAYAKIHTYSLQKTPFLHVDGDVFIWKAFDSKLLKGDLIAQSLEDNLDIYRHSIEALKSEGQSYLPEWIEYAEKHPKAYNAGILGGSDISFFYEYCDLAFEFYCKNESAFNSIIKKDDNINIIPEQYLFYVLSKKHKKRVSLLKKDIKSQMDFADYAKIEEIPNEETFMHTLGGFKQSPNVNNFISYALRKEAPNIWDHIKSLAERKCKFKDDVSKNICQKFHRTSIIAKKINVPFSLEGESPSNPILLDIYDLERKQTRIGNNLSHSVQTEAFPTYCKENIFLLDNILDYFVFVHVNHEILISKYDWSAFLINSLGCNKLSPFRSSCVVVANSMLEFPIELRLNDALLSLLEILKKSPTRLVEILSLFQNKDKSYILQVLKSWYSHGLIYFSKNKEDFIPQEPSKAFVEHQNNLKTQVGTNVAYIFKHYKIQDIDKEKVHSLDNIGRNISLSEILQLLQSLRFETKGVRGTLDSLSQIPLPAIALVNIRNYLPLYVVITEVESDRVTIYNPENKEHEIYTKEYFKTIWDGILLLTIPITE